MIRNVRIMNQIKIFSVLDVILKDAINQKLQVKLDKLEQTLRTQLSQSPNLEVILQLLQEQKYEARTVLKLTGVRKTRTKKEINSDTRCMARIGLGTQCSRSRIVDPTARPDIIDYCKSHMMSLPYGRIDVPDNSEQKIAKKRGRRSAVEKKYDIEELDMTKYVNALLIQIEDKPYLVDQNNVIYQYNASNVIAGRLVDEESGTEDVRVEWY
jgi:hypothetical protein